MNIKHFKNVLFILATVSFLVIVFVGTHDGIRFDLNNKTVFANIDNENNEKLNTNIKSNENPIIEAQRSTYNQKTMEKELKLEKQIWLEGQQKLRR